MDLDPIVFLITDLSNTGGTASVVRTLAEHEARRHRRVVIAALDSDVHAFELPANVEFVHLGLDLRRFNRWVRAACMPIMLVLMGIRLRAIRPSIVVSFLPRANIVAVAVRSARVFGRFKVVVSERNFNEIQYRTRLGRVLKIAMRLAYRRADLVLANSGAVARSLEADFGCARDSITTLPNPVAVDRVRADAGLPLPVTLPGDIDTRVLFVGRFVAQKNLPLLIDAVERIDDGVHLILVGDGPERDAVKAYVRARSLDSRVHLFGWDPHPSRYYRACAVVALASDYEGMPNAIAEAMTCGAAIVATDAPGGTRELTGGTAVLVAPGDVGAMAAALTELLNDAPRRARLGAAARVRAEEFADAGVSARFQSIVDRVAAVGVTSNRSFFRHVYPKVWLSTERDRSAHTSHVRYQSETLRRVPPGHRVLEIGCGSGELLLRLAASSAHVVGVDLGTESLRAARARCGDQTTLALADAGTLPFASGCFDAVLCSSVLWYVPDIETAIAEMSRVTRPGGTIVFDVRSPWHVSSQLAALSVRIRRAAGRSAPRYRLVSRGELRRILASVDCDATVEGFFAILPTRLPLLGARGGDWSALSNRLAFGAHQGALAAVSEKLLVTAVRRPSAPAATGCGRRQDLPVLRD